MLSALISWLQSSYGIRVRDCDCLLDGGIDGFTLLPVAVDELQVMGNPLVPLGSVLRMGESGLIGLLLCLPEHMRA